MKPNSKICAVFFLTLVSTAFLSVGCGPGTKTLEPRIAEKEVVLPRAHEERWGSTDSYEHKMRADVLLGRGRLEEALREQRQALDSDPDDFLLRTEYAILLMKAGELHRAKTHLARALLEEPTAQVAWTALATLHLKLNHPDKAEAAAMRGMKVDPKDHEAALWLAQFYEERKENERSRELYRRVVTLCPDLLEARLGLGRMARTLGDPAESQEHLLAYLALGGKNSEAVVQVAEEYLAQGDTAHGLNLLSMALSEDSSNDTLRIKLIELLLNSNLLRRAERNILSLSTPAPEDIEGVEQRVRWLMAVGRDYLARDIIVKFAGASPHNVQLRLLLAEVELKLLRLESMSALLDDPEIRWTDEQAKQVNELRQKMLLSAP